jgi:hypothetical protein
MAFKQPTNVVLWLELRKPPLRSVGLSRNFFCCMQNRLRVLRYCVSVYGSWLARDLKE